MFVKLFENKKRSEEVLVAPLKGKIIPIEQVPDPVFSEKMIGDGVAVEPFEGKVVAPVDGEVVQFFPTKHAIGIKSKSGVEILIHIGLETVTMDGEGFQGHVKMNEKVKAGDLLITFDPDLVKERAKSTVTPVVITNGDQVEITAKMYNHSGVIGETEIMRVKKKG